MAHNFKGRTNCKGEKMKKILVLFLVLVTSSYCQNYIIGVHRDGHLPNKDEQIDKIPPEKYGIALKVMDKTGKTIFEVKKIKTGVNPPSHYLQLPAGYKTMSMMQMMQQQMQSDMPPPTK